MENLMEIETKNKFGLTDTEVVSELLYHYHEIDLEFKYNLKINNATSEELEKVFESFISEHSKSVKVEEIYNDYQNSYIFVNTPDGFNKITDFYKKEKQSCLEIKTLNNSCKSSSKHLFEKEFEGNWAYADNLNIGDSLFTKNGYENITEINKIEDSIVYDFTVNHINQRYWGGTGISSHNTGKSFLCYNICKEAQTKGYSIIYIDTEYAIELDQLPGYGIDISEDKFTLIRSNVIEDLKIFMTKTLDSLKDIKESGKDIPKIMIVLDSIGQLGSRKEVEDALSGKEKADFTKAKALASFFRIINSDLGYLKIAFLATAHTYETMDMYPQTKIRGGEGPFYAASTIAFLSKAKLKEGIEDDLDLGQSGIVVTAKMVKNRMAKPKKVKFEISFVSGCNKYVGLDYWLTPENFDQIGICKGKMVEGKFVAGGNKWYVRHLGKHVPGADLFTSNVFTDEVLNSMEPIINEYFKFKSITEIDEINKKLEESKGQISEKDLYGEDNLSSSALFDDED